MTRYAAFCMAAEQLAVAARARQVLPLSRLRDFTLSIVIVNYNKGALILSCLDSILKTSEGLPLDVIVVDNASSDGIAEVLPNRYPQVRLIVNSVNLGFAKAANQALATTQGLYILLLNPDTVVMEGALRTLVGYLEANPEIGALGPQMVGPDGIVQLSCRRFPGYSTALFGHYSLLTRWFPQNPFSRRYLLSDWDHRTVRAVDWVSGACLMTRRDVLERVGFLDEQFFLFNEDVDWCKRIRDAGWKVVYVPEARVIHHIGASKDKVPVALVIARHRGMVHYYRKHLRRGLFWDRLVALLIWVRCGCHLLLNMMRRS